MSTQLVVKKKGKNWILYENGMIRLDRIRMSYPHLDKPWKKEGDAGVAKYSLTGMLDKETHAEAIEFLRTHQIALIKAEKDFTVKADKRFARDGDAGQDDGDDAGGENSYAGHWYVSAREERRPSLRDNDGTLLDPETELEAIRSKFYGGAYGHMLIRPWAQNNKHGQRLNAGLSAVVFWKDGEPFGSGSIDDSDAWDDLPEDDDAPAAKKSAPKRTAIDDEEM